MSGAMKGAAPQYAAYRPATPVKRAPAEAQGIEGAFYEKRQKIYPREVHGVFAALRTTAVFALLGLFFILPWLQLDGRQLVLFDLPARKFYIFWLTFWPQDFLLLAFLLILAAFALFFFTALAGRLWCGYACPQTVWTEVFFWLERKFEGSRARQMKLDKAAPSLNKLLIKLGKHGCWLLISLLTAFTFVAYFSPAERLLNDFAGFNLHPWEAFWIGFFTLATYLNAGWMREQVCQYMCPYARFQSAMFDRDTLIISYDKGRGDPRGSRRPGQDYKAKGLGDCINCTLCVQVCPTGIDIRDGLQFECIGCSACIDVCDQVMDKMGYPRGLIRYTTENALRGRPSRFLRPRILVYLALLVILSGLFLFSVSQRALVELDVIRDRNQLYRETAGQIENIYTLKLINKDDLDHRFTLSVAGIEGLRLLLDKEAILVEAGTVADLPVRVRASEDNLAGRSTPFYFTLTATGRALSVKEKARFLGPLP